VSRKWIVILILALAGFVAIGGEVRTCCSDRDVLVAGVRAAHLQLSAGRITEARETLEKAARIVEVDLARRE